MLFKEYGGTGARVSAVGMGGMRFDEGGGTEYGAELVRYAHSKGINYFDTAPDYCNDMSEDALGLGLEGLERSSFFVTSKTKFGTVDRPATEKGFFNRLEKSLKRLRVDYIDFYFLWCMLSLGSYRKQCDTMYGWFVKAKEMGLIKHICVSSHMDGADVSSMLDEGLFEGVLLGYNALNYRYRQEGIITASKRNMGVAVMNPLGGGVIPKNAQRFDYLTSGTEYSAAQAALRFVASHKEVSVALVGFGNKTQVDEAVYAVENLDVKPAGEVIASVESGTSGYNNLCTGCGYCDHCPEGISIPKYMDAYNQKLFGESPSERFMMHWGIPAEGAKKCTGCGKCEALCTQHLPIRERLKELAQI